MKRRSEGTIKPQNASYDLESQGLAEGPNLAYEGSVTLVWRKAYEAVVWLLDHYRRTLSVRTSLRLQL